MDNKVIVGLKRLKFHTFFISIHNQHLSMEFELLKHEIFSSLQQLILLHEKKRLLTFYLFFLATFQHMIDPVGFK